MMNRLVWFAMLLCPALLLAHSAPAHAQMRWAAMLQDGEIIEGNSLTDWQIANARPKLDGRELLQDDNPFLWVRDCHPDRTPQSQPTSFVEFSQGDILPGEVTGWRTGSPSPYDPQEDYFIVSTKELLGIGADNANPEVRVSPKYVRRIVWQPLTNTAFEPGTIFYRNGRKIAFRSWRGGSQGLSVLTSGGLQQVPFEEIAELHLPAPEFWESYCDEVAALLPNGQGRLYTIRTMAGMMATASLSQLQVQAGAPNNQPDLWIHGIQPIWSLDPLWIRGATVWLRQSYLPTELPLNKLTPTEEVESDLFGAASWAWQRDLNVQSGRLRAAAVPYGWGYGVHAPSQLVFALPAAALSLRASVAIDEASESGGCAQARILAGNDRSVLFESPVLTGDSETVVIGPLDLTGLRVRDHTKTIVLEVDPALENRPAGADPLDIRDDVDWLDPRIELDPAVLAAEVARRFPQFVRAWDGWNVELGVPEALIITHAAVDPSPLTSRGLFRYSTSDFNAGTVLSQELPESTNNRWLMISAHLAEGNGARLEIRADGLPVASYVVPTADEARQNPAAYLLPLAPLNGLAEKIEIVVQPPEGSPEASPIVWKCIRIIDQLPMVYAIFEDDPALLTHESRAASEIITDDPRVHSGQAALQFPVGQSVEIEFPQPLVIDGEPGWGEYRYMRFAIRKQGGMAGIEFLHTGKDDRSLSFEAGAGTPLLDDSVRVWTLELGGDWIVISRDLYSDFGKVEITGIRLFADQGDIVLFDQLLLSRRADGFDSLPAPPNAEYETMVELLRTANPAMLAAPAATAHLEMDGKHTMALCIDAEGYLVTSADLPGCVGREATVYFRDQPLTQAVVHSIDREHNLALWKIADAGPWPAVTLAGSPAATGTPAVMLSLSNGELWRAVDVKLTEVGPTDDRFLNAPHDPPGNALRWGGAMLGLNGEVLGLARARKPDSALAYTQASVLAGQLERLKQGGAYGSWEPHTAPQLGLTLTPIEGGLQITAVDANLPAGASGMQVNDILTKFNGQAVATQEQYDAQLRQCDARQVLSLEIKRGEEVLTLTPTLVPLSL